MARVAFIDDKGTVMSAVWRAQQEGHRVTYWLKDGDSKVQRVGRGLVPRAGSLQDVVGFRPDVVVAYNVCDEAEQLAKQGLTIWGSSNASMDMEEDRIEANELAKRYGVGESLTTERFHSIVEALRAIEHAEHDGFVIKAEGADVDTDSTKVCHDREEASAVVRSMTKAESFVIQEKIEGVEVSTEGWFDYRVGWIPPFNSTLERKRLMPGDVGPMTGAMGSVVFVWPGDSPRLPQQTVMKLEPYLRQIQYVGPIDVNSIVNDGTPYFLEFTPRLGWDAFEAFMSGYAGNLGDMFVALGRGELEEHDFTAPWMAAVRIALKAETDIPLLAPWRENRHLFLGAVWQDSGGRLRSTQVDCDNGLTTIFEVGNAGEALDDVMGAIYDRYIPRIHVDGIVYRNDIGKQATADIYTLRSWGYECPEPLQLRGMAMYGTGMMGTPPLRDVRG